MPYAPNTSYRGDQSILMGFQGLGQGLEQAGAAMGDAMRERKDERKRINAGQSVYDKLMGVEDPDYDPSAMSARQKYDAYNAMKEAAQYGMMVQQSEAERLMNVQRQAEINAPPPQPWKPSPVDFDNDGTPDMLMTSPSSAVAVPRESSPPQLMGPQGPAVQYKGMIGTWDPKLGGYSNWKPQDAGDSIQAGGVTINRGGVDYSQIPQYIESSAAPSRPGFYGFYPSREIMDKDAMVDSYVQRIMGGQPAAATPRAEARQPSPAAVDAPPMEGARKASDGKWYLQKGGKWFRVEK